MVRYVRYAVGGRAVAHQLYDAMTCVVLQKSEHRGRLMNRPSILLICLALIPVGIHSANGQSTLLRDLETSYQFDGVGNIAHIARSTGDGYVDTQSVAYYYNAPQWLMATPTQLQNQSTTPDGTSVLKTTQFVPDPNTGVILNVYVEPKGDESTFANLQYRFDAHGALSALITSDLSGRQQRAVSTQFDALEDLYPIFRTNPLGQTESFGVHPAFGVVVAYVDPNGAAGTWQYDQFGRPKTVLPPDGANVSLAYGGPEFDVTVQYKNDRKSDILYDPYLYEVQRDVTGFNGQTIVRLTSYNGQNIVAEQDGPCFYGNSNCSGSASELYSYDELGRIDSALDQNKNGPKWAYSGLKTTHYDAVGNQRYLIRDQLGRIQKSAAISTDAHEIPTTFGYGPFNRLSTVTDAEGDTTAFARDVRGRTTSILDPDAGAATFEWNCFDEITDEIGGDGNETTFVRDGLGRIQSALDVGSGKTATFQWDTSPNGIGKIASATSRDAVATAYSYNPAGQLIGVNWNVGANAYGFALAYDPIGRIATMTYPSGSQQPPFAVEPKYNQFGFLYQLIDANSGSMYWQIDNENERGEVTNQHFGNGVATQRMFGPKGEITAIQTTSASNILQDLHYSYYPNGSLQERNNRFSLYNYSLSEFFKFDPLDRIYNVHSVGFRYIVCPACPKAQPSQTSANFGEINVFDENFVYDDIGNLRQKVINTGSGTSVSYQYGQNAGPHALTQANVDTYHYDPAGNQTQWASANGSSRTIGYNSANLPVSITLGSNAAPNPLSVAFQYDANNNRVVRQDSSGNSFTQVGGLYEQRASGSQTTNVFYLPGPEGRIIGQVLRGSGQGSGQTYYFNTDALGSLQTVTDNSGAALEQLWYEPFGQTIDPTNPGNRVTPNLTSTRQDFTSHFKDSDLDLIDMIGRVYDPNVAHFLTADPFVQDRVRSESLNRYSYGWNNPLKWTDPSGYENEPLAGFDCSGGMSNDLNGTPDAGSNGGFVSCVGLGWDADSDEPELSLKTNSFVINNLGVQFTGASVDRAGKSESAAKYDPATELGTFTKSEGGGYGITVLKGEVSLTSLPTLEIAELEATSGSNTRLFEAGNWMFGEFLEVKTEGPAASLSLGLNGGTLEATAGASAVSGRISGGVNLFGANVSVYGQARYGVKFGAEAGAEGVSVHCGPLSCGVNLGAAKTAEPEPGWTNAYLHFSGAIEQAAALTSFTSGSAPMPTSASAADIFGFLGSLWTPPPTQVEPSTSSDNGLFPFLEIFQQYSP
jgi:RHS repeat-associated protein